MYLADFLARGDSLADLVVGGFPISHIRQAGYNAPSGSNP